MRLIESVAPGFSNADTVWTYEQIAQKTESVKKVLSERGIRLHRLSVLAQIFDKTSVLSKEWSARDRTDGWLDRLVAAAHAIRIADAVLEAKDDVAAQECFVRIAKGNMTLSERKESQGKDALWELELLSYFRRHGLAATLAEPDIVVPMNWGDYPVACKKINSEQGTENQLKKARKQLATFGGHGIIALNIDETSPEEPILGGSSAAAIGQSLSTLLQQFTDRHRDALQDSVMNGRCDGVVLSMTVLVDVKNSNPRLNNQTQIHLWHLSDGPTEARTRFRAFGETLFSSVALNAPR